MVILKKEFSIIFILTFLGVNGEDLIIKLDEHGIAASHRFRVFSSHSRGITCIESNGVLITEQITGSLRMSFGYMNTLDEVEQTVEVLKKVVSGTTKCFSLYKAIYDF